MGTWYLACARICGRHSRLTRLGEGAVWLFLAGGSGERICRPLTKVDEARNG
ncbi:MAG: hypothetical protein ACI87O_001255 [Planctomycetota bacterium]|jgi:hypothetical protein